MSKKEKRSSEAPIVSVWQSGETRFPMFHRNRAEYDAFFFDRRNQLGRREVGYYPLFLHGDTFAERKAEYITMLSEMGSKNWCDYYYYLSRSEYPEFKRALFAFCEKYARVFGLRDFTKEAIKHIELL